MDVLQTLYLYLIGPHWPSGTFPLPGHPPQILVSPLAALFHTPTHSNLILAVYIFLSPMGLPFPFCGQVSSDLPSQPSPVWATLSLSTRRASPPGLRPQELQFLQGFLHGTPTPCPCYAHDHLPLPCACCGELLLLSWTSVNHDVLFLLPYWKYAPPSDSFH